MINSSPLKITLAAALFAALLSVTQAEEEKGLTFFGWSDQHIKTDGNADHVLPFVEAMNVMEGVAYPPNVGGKVAKPAFVFGAGDITEWPTNASMVAYETILKEKLKIPAYDVLGNHDDGGNSPSETMKRWAIKRHGSLSYTFENAGIHFIALWSKFDPALNQPSQPLTKKALDHVRNELAKIPKGEPVVIATHLCYDAMTNRDELVEAIGDANVVMILGGHYHKAVVHRYKSLNWVQLPSPKSEWNEFTVIRITPKRLLALPYDFKKKAWVLEPRKMLDVEVKK